MSYMDLHASQFNLILETSHAFLFGTWDYRAHEHTYAHDNHPRLPQRITQGS